ncbi:hypothetical protein ABPG75_013487 [Micractinium tetrahymenae]
MRALLYLAAVLVLCTLSARAQLPIPSCDVACQQCSAAIKANLTAALAATNSSLTPQCFESYLDKLSALPGQRTTLIANAQLCGLQPPAGYDYASNIEPPAHPGCYNATCLACSQQLYALAQPSQACAQMGALVLNISGCQPACQAALASTVANASAITVTGPCIEAYLIGKRALQPAQRATLVNNMHKCGVPLPPGYWALISKPPPPPPKPSPPPPKPFDFFSPSPFPLPLEPLPAPAPAPEPAAEPAAPAPEAAPSPELAPAPAPAPDKFPATGISSPPPSPPPLTGAASQRAGLPAMLVLAAAAAALLA